MKVWITKYAMTTGIKETEAKECTIAGMISVGKFEFYHVEGREWHRTKESAIAKAEKMRKDKLSSLRKSIKRIEALSFSASGGNKD